MEYEEMRRQAATEIAIDSGTIRSCEVHDDILLEGDVNVEAAYKLGNVRFSAGKMDGIFSSRREMTDYIQSVVELADPRCERCSDPD
jgi:hypothetical protein